MIPASLLPFFVYGTLRRDQCHHGLFQGDVRRCELATVTGYAMYDGGAFPYAAPSPGGRIVGDLITVDSSRYTSVLAVLDRLEGFRPDDPAASHYVRVGCCARNSAGIGQPAWVYVAGPLIDITKYPRHRAGDWTVRPAAQTLCGPQHPKRA